MLEQIKGLRSLIPRIGGKTNLATRFLPILCPGKEIPPVFVEPYCGSGAIYLSILRNIGRPEFTVLNDLDSGLISTYYHVARYPQEIKIAMQPFRFSTESYKNAVNKYKSNIPEYQGDTEYNITQSALYLFISAVSYSHQLNAGFCGGGSTSGATIYQGLVITDRIKRISAALQDVYIENKDGLKVTYRHMRDGDTLIYLDPPYPQSVREPGLYGDYEVADNHHRRLLKLITDNSVKARIGISGFGCRMYDDALTDWNRHEFARRRITGTNANPLMIRKDTETEILWTNF